MEERLSLKRAISKNQPLEQRIRACLEIGNQRHDELIPALIPLLREKQPRLREAAVRSLGRFSNPDLLQHIMRTLSDRDTRVRDTAFEIIRIKGKDIKPQLHQALNTGGRLSRVAAASILAELGEKEIVPHLIEELGNCDRSYVLSIRQSLSKLNEDAIASLFPELYLQQPDSIEAARALLAAYDYRFISPLIRYLKMCRHSPYHYDIHQVLKSLDADAVKYKDPMLCMTHLRRFARRRFISNFYPFQYSPYVCCLECGKTIAGKRVTTLIVALDEQLPSQTWRDEETIVVNWIKQDGLCDFDEVEIREVSEQDVNRFCLAIGNDTDRHRRKHYKRVTCRIYTDSLNANTKQLLARAFGKIEQV